MTGLIGLFDRTRDCTSQLTVTHTLVLTVTSSPPLLGSGFQNCPLPQPPASDSNSSQWLNPSNSVTAAQVKVRVTHMIPPTVSRLVCLRAKPHLWHKSRLLLLSDICGFLDMGRPLWWEDGSLAIGAGPRRNSYSWVPQTHDGGWDGQGVWHAWWEKRNACRLLVGMP
jgi:hypothetical protein